MPNTEAPPLLGVDGTCIICHGRSDHVAIRNAVRVATEYLDNDLNTVIAEELAKESAANQTTE